MEELSPGAALCIYRVTQEALGNVAKHAQAKQVHVRLTRSDNRVCLSVSDDGVGFNARWNRKIRRPGNDQYAGAHAPTKRDV